MSNKKETTEIRSDFKQIFNGFSQLWNSETQRWESEISTVGLANSDWSPPNPPPRSPKGRGGSGWGRSCGGGSWAGASAWGASWAQTGTATKRIANSSSGPGVCFIVRGLPCQGPVFLRESIISDPDGPRQFAGQKWPLSACPIDGVRGGWKLPGSIRW